MTNTLHYLSRPKLVVPQTVSSRNRLSSLNISAFSSRSAKSLSRHAPNLGLRLDSALRTSNPFLSNEHGIPIWMLSTGSGLLLNSGR